MPTIETLLLGVVVGMAYFAVGSAAGRILRAVRRGNDRTID